MGPETRGWRETLHHSYASSCLIKGQHLRICGENMPATSFIVVSDLHLADGHAVLEGFGPQQQSALDGILQATLPGGALGNTTTPATLIINGDCFEFLALPPYPEDGCTTPAMA